MKKKQKKSKFNLPTFKSFNSAEKKELKAKQEIIDEELKSFFDTICPSALKFFPDYYILGNTYRSVWAIRGYPPKAEEYALLKDLGDYENVTVKIYTRPVKAVEQKKIIKSATNRNKQELYQSEDLTDTINASENINDIKDMLINLRQKKEPLLYTAVYIEIQASSFEELSDRRDDLSLLLSKIGIIEDKLLLHQKEGFLSVCPIGYNALGKEFERILPSSSVANLYPFNYSGKTDSKGFYLGKDKYGTNIIVDLNRRDYDKTNGNVLILGNSGQGKSYLQKDLVLNVVLGGYSVILLDPDEEYRDLTLNLGGDYIDLLSGRYFINVLEPKVWNIDEEENDGDTPKPFISKGILNQHIAFLRDFFSNYKKTFTDEQLDILEIMLFKLYKKFGITETTDFQNMKNTNYPILQDLYNLIDEEKRKFDPNNKDINYTEEHLKKLLLALESICKGTDSKYFNGCTNISNEKILCFGVKGLLETNESLKNAMLFNILSFMSQALLVKGNTVGSIDELHTFLSSKVLIQYIRNFIKRVRKKNSSLILASQNLEDFILPQIQEFTKPLFSIPTHHFLFNPGTIDKNAYMNLLQLDEAEYKVISLPERGNCLYRCGAERYNLQVIVPEYKAKLFGEAGGV